MTDDKILTIEELATYLKRAEKTVYRFASEGRLPSFKVGGAWIFRKSEINQWKKSKALRLEAKNQSEE